MVARRLLAGRAWQAYVVVSLVPLVAYSLLPDAAQRIVYDAVAVAAGLAVLAGIGLHRPQRPGAWYLLAAAQLLWAAGDIAWNMIASDPITAPFPTVADGLYVAAYVVAFLGLLDLLRTRIGVLDWRAGVDAGIVGIEIAGVGFVLLFHPITSSATGPQEAVEGLLYPLLDVVLIAALAPLLTLRGRASPYAWLLMTSLVAMFTADALFSLAGLDQLDPVVADTVYLVGYTAWGAAALHPSMSGQAPGRTAWQPRLTPLRIGGYVVALILPAAILALHHGPIDPLETSILLVALAALALLIYVRLADLVREISQAEELRRTLLEGSADAIYLVGGDPPAILSANHAAADLLGRPDDELVGLQIATLLRPADRSAQRDRVGAMRTSRETIRLELDIVRADGGIVPVELSEKAMHDGRIVGVMHDVSERHRSEAERARLSAALEQTSDLALIADLTGHVLFVNHAFTLATGIDAADAPGLPAETFRSSAGIDPADPRLLEAVRAEGRWSEEVRMCRPGGEDRVVDVAATIIRVPGGTPDAYVAIGRDVTEQHALESQLREAQRMEAVGQLAGGMAHDFNNLLTAIRGYSEIILGSARVGDRVSPDDVEEVLRATDRAAVLTRQMLDFARRQHLRPRPVDPSTVVAGAVPLLRSILGEGVELVVSAPSGQGLVVADPQAIEQVLVNLAANARDATPGGGRVTFVVEALEVTTETDGGPSGPAAGAYMRISVADTGAGMDERVRLHAFEPFFTTKRPGRGTGLGLASVYGIVKQSGGYVRIDSRPGEGTRVDVLLPRVTGDVSEPAPAEPVVAAPPGHGWRVLVVDDEKAVRAVARHALERRGYTVHEAGNGDEAVAIAEDESVPIDLVITDVVMPGMGGRELGERLATLRPGVPIIYMSGFNEERIGPMPRSSPGVQFVAKPFSGEALAAAAARALADAGADPQRAGTSPSTSVR